MELSGQILGWLAAFLTFLSYQCKEQKKLIFIQILSAASLCVSYLLLGAYSGMVLNVVCILRNVIIYKKNVKFFSYSFWPYVLTLTMGLTGIFSWQGHMSLLIIVALMINTIFIYMPNIQNLRKSILLTSTMVILYNVYYSVWGGVTNELIAIVSSAIGLYRYRKTKQR